MDDHEKRISTNEANIQNIGLVIIELKDYMKASASDRAANHTDIIQRLSIIETKQDAFKEYQENCELDRKEIADRVLIIERDDSRQAGRSSIINAIISALVAGSVTIISAFYGSFHK